LRSDRNSARVSRAGAGHHADRDGDGGQRRAKYRDQHQQQHEIGQGLECFRDAHQHIVDPAAIKAGEGANQDADRDRNRGGDSADQQ
jgi:hypothetical protein